MFLGPDLQQARFPCDDYRTSEAQDSCEPKVSLTSLVYETMQEPGVHSDLPLALASSPVSQEQRHLLHVLCFADDLALDPACSAPYPGLEILFAA